MHPVAVGNCFGWLHMPPGGAGSRIAVILCPGLRHDGLTGYRQLRLLATALADAGYPTLRFEYPGTADSGDPDDGTELWTAWLHSVHAAADWVRNVTGAHRVVLCGLRLGAMLAAVAASARTDIAGLVLLAPVARGKTFIRQMEIEAKLSGHAGQTGYLNLDGLHLPTATVAAITASELGKVRLPAGCAVAVFSPASPALEQCALAWRRDGAAVTEADFSGLEPMLRPTFMIHEPAAQVGRVVEWLHEAVPAAAGEPAAVPPPPVLTHAGCEETPLRFGPGNALFGMLCRPQGHPGDFVVVIVNSGGDPRYGFARGAVDVARRFAAAGIASLRMDFTGLGDSIAASDGETHVFQTGRQADVAAALDALAALGFRSFALNGLCSGAFHAFHAALADDRIEALLLVNLPLFEWRPGEKVELLNHTLEGPAHVVGSLQSRDVWRRLLRGQIDIHGYLAAQRHWAAAKVATASARLLRQAGFEPRSSFARTAMLTLSRRTRLLLLMAQKDSGLAALTTEFGAADALPGGTLRILPDIDHALTTAPMRARITDLMVDFLRNESPRRPAGSGGA